MTTVVYVLAAASAVGLIVMGVRAIRLIAYWSDNGYPVTRKRRAVGRFIDFIRGRV